MEKKELTRKEVFSESACGFIIDSSDSHIEVFGKDFKEVNDCLHLIKKEGLIGGK